MRRLSKRATGTRGDHEEVFGKGFELARGKQSETPFRGFCWITSDFHVPLIN